MNYEKYLNYLDYETEIEDAYHNLLLEYKISDNFSDEHWLYNLPSNITQSKGFKIHLSASILNANLVAKKFFDFIFSREKKINFKILVSIKELSLQNTGLNGYSQVGKFITIYPKDNKEFQRLLHKLEILYKGVKGVNIPSDFRFQLSEVVYYRYGEFVKDSTFKDKRDKKIPSNVNVPIRDYYIPRYNTIPVINEREILVELEKEEFTPKVFNDFYIKNSYFVEFEFIIADKLSEYNMVSGSYDWFLTLIDYMEIINSKYNLSYRDLSFNNILIDNRNNIYIIDFEHALRKETQIEEKKLPLFGTPGFYETNLNLLNNQPEDIMGLVLLLYWSQNLDDFNVFSKMSFLEAMEYAMNFNSRRLDTLDKSDWLYDIYKKAFNYKYDTFSELKKDFIEVLK
ncbi:TPA: protein kinase [Streptococcus pneumoniae]|uniref:class III lanthionine synthetase LanKC N-terminal domain-containing protein n=1 Tax=Streptococcus pneumoniae TaxID=1313 RepID=UPI0010E924EE|nr:protein kinase [Streptococcus pneumoniae]MBW8164616.1 protein kinase [Streptococcus pneumoniae]VSR94777.1 protein kinase [Streptococcus pneumoniae]